MPARTPAAALSRLFALVVCTSLLASCGATLVEKGAELRDARPCCADLGGMYYAALKAGETRLVSIISGDPAYQFDTSLSRGGETLDRFL